MKNKRKERFGVVNEDVNILKKYKVTFIQRYIVIFI